LPAAGKYLVTDVLDDREIPAPAAGVLAFHQPPHSVRVLKIVDNNIPAVAPAVTTDHPAIGNAGATLKFAASSRGDDAVLSYHWDFGDGVTLEGREVNHTYTEPGEYKVHLTATGLSGLVSRRSLQGAYLWIHADDFRSSEYQALPTSAVSGSSVTSEQGFRRTKQVFLTLWVSFVQAKKRRSKSPEWVGRPADRRYTGKRGCWGCDFCA
jgi:hypothetical protein